METEKAYLSKAAIVASMLGPESYWVCPSKNGVYSLWLYSPYPFVNNQYPYQLRIFSYQPSANFYADTLQNLGGIGIDGIINGTELNFGWKGTLINKDQIMWNDGSIWQRTTPPVNRHINQYNPWTAYQQAEQQSAMFNRIYNKAYPNIERTIPW